MKVPRKQHRSQQPLRRGPLYLAKRFSNVRSFSPMFQIWDILCCCKVMRLESAEVGGKSPKNLKVYTSQNVGDTDRAPSELRYKITPHPGKGPVGRHSSAS